MDKQYIIEITFNKVKQSLHIRRIKDVSIPVTCVGNNDSTYPTTRLIPSNMSLDYLFEVAKAEHQRTHKAV